jgi:hypothetical protein
MKILRLNLNFYTLNKNNRLSQFLKCKLEKNSLLISINKNDFLQINDDDN